MRASAAISTAEEFESTVLRDRLKLSDVAVVSYGPDPGDKKAEERAEQTVAELKRRYDERHALLRDMAEQREDEALEAAFEVLRSAEL